jgi:transcriptional regulator with XRE-family HTH domain
MNVYDALGKRIKEKRLKAGLSQEKLSELCDLSPSYIGIIERGEGKLSVETLVRIANVLKVNADYLLGDSIKLYYTSNVDKAAGMLRDMDEEEIEYTCNFIRRFRDFQGKKPID